MTVDEPIDPPQPYVTADGGNVELYPNGPCDVGRCLTPGEAEDLAVRLLLVARTARLKRFEIGEPCPDMTPAEDMQLAMRVLSLNSARICSRTVRVEWGEPFDKGDQ